LSNCFLIRNSHHSIGKFFNLDQNTSLYLCHMKYICFLHHVYRWYGMIDKIKDPSLSYKILVLNIGYEVVHPYTHIPPTCLKRHTHRMKNIQKIRHQYSQDCRNKYAFSHYITCLRHKPNIYFRRQYKYSITRYIL
jgi:hypothetical protein